MSASLVGSEMCIRDSAPPAQPAPVVATPPTANGTARTVCRSAAQWRWTVSYTHLTLPTICSV
eukprot:13589809-Alexandrium_andersonii.AAC.1